MSTAEDAAENTHSHENMASPPKASSSSNITEFEPPLASVRRMLKNTLPSSTNVGKDAASAFSRACGIFVIYLTACANDFAREGKRQTITANDILAAVKELDFEEFAPKLAQFIEQHRDDEKKKKEAKTTTKHERDGQSREDETSTPDAKRRKGSEDVSVEPSDNVEMSASMDEEEEGDDDGSQEDESLLDTTSKNDLEEVEDGESITEENNENDEDETAQLQE